LSKTKGAKSDETLCKENTMHGSGSPQKRKTRRVFAGLMVVLGLGAIDQSIIATALPRIVNDLGDVTYLPWIVTGYVFSSTITMPLYGKLADHYGRKPLIQAAVFTFILGSVLGGVAQSLPQLVLFRAIQGIGAGGFLPLSQIILTDYVPPHRRGKRQGAFVAVFAVCSVIGPVLGGVITDLLSWRWIFYVNLPIGGIALFTISLALSERSRTRGSQLDLIGALLMSCCTAAFLLVITCGGSEWPWLSAETAGLSIGCALFLMLLVRHIHRTPEPVLPVELFSDRVFVMACTVMALMFMALFGSTLFFPLFFQTVMGMAASKSGLLTTPLMAGVVIASVVNGRFLLRSGRQKMTQIVGVSMAAGALVLLAWATSMARGLPLIEIALFSLGVGVGFVMPNMMIVAQNALPAIHRGVGTAALSFVRSLGGLVGIAGAGAIFKQLLYSEGQSGPVSGFKLKAPLEGSPSSTQMLAHIDTTLGPIYRNGIVITLVVASLIVTIALLIILRLPEVPLADRTLPDPSSNSV
jgi:EmrB/QacA subfamily drug resistance transporter